MNERKKLLFVITQGVVGGAQKNVFDLASNFKSGYEVSVAIGGEEKSDLAQKLKNYPVRSHARGKIASLKDHGVATSNGIKTHHLKFLGRDLNILDDFLVFFEILKLYKKEKPDIIHLHSSKVGLIGSVAGFIYKIGVKNKPKIIFTAHGWIFKEEMSKEKRFVAVFLTWFAAKFQDKIICVSEDDFNKAIKYKVAPARKLFVIHNAINNESFLTKEKARAEIGKMIGKELLNDSFIITNLGRLYANKGLNYLIEAVHDLSSKIQDLRLVIFGDGPERQTLQGMIENYKLENSVFLVGDKSNASQYLKAFDVMVLSSVKEGFPYALLEAGMASIPVIATNVGGIGEIIKDGETGILIESKNIKNLTDSILKIYNDKEFGQKISGNLKKVIIKDFSFDSLIEKTDWIYRV